MPARLTRSAGCFIALTMKDAPIRTLTPGWRALFRLEIPLCLATAGYWLIAPDHFLRAMFGPVAVDAVHRWLLRQSAVTVLALLAWFYGRWLFQPTVDLRAFRLLQEGMALGDAAIVALSVHLTLTGHPAPAMIAAQIAVAAFWCGARVVFLARHR